MLSVGDAEKLNVPIAMYVSKDEPIEEVRIYYVGQRVVFSSGHLSTRKYWK